MLISLVRVLFRLIPVLTGNRSRRAAQVRGITVNPRAYGEQSDSFGQLKALLG